jgi:hypothetical protein
VPRYIAARRLGGAGGSGSVRAREEEGRVYE